MDHLGRRLRVPELRLPTGSHPSGILSSAPAALEEVTNVKTKLRNEFVRSIKPKGPDLASGDRRRGGERPERRKTAWIPVSVRSNLLI